MIASQPVGRHPAVAGHSADLAFARLDHQDVTMTRHTSRLADTRAVPGPSGAPWGDRTVHPTAASARAHRVKRLMPALAGVAAALWTSGTASPVLAQEASGVPPVVWVLATGGTISGGGSSSTSLTEYRAGAYSGEELVAAVPAIAEHATIRVEQVANIGSPNITFDDWLTLARRIDDIFRGDPDAAGVVITHGTNTLEETAYFLNLTVRHDRPVVLVGAQPPATAIRRIRVLYFAIPSAYVLPM